MASYGLTLIKRTGGVDTSDANAGPYQILKGYSGYVDDERIEGTMPNRGTHNYSLPVNSSHNIPDGWHNGSGKITQSLSTQGSVTITPGTSAKLVCSANKWTTGNLWVKGDADLVAGNIKYNVKLFGLTGTYKGCVTTDATITADKILTGYSAYGSAGTKINGTMPNRGAISHSLAANGSYTVPIGWHNGNGKITQSLSTQGGWTATPGTSAKLLCDSKKWTTGDIWVKGDADLVAGNIKNGVKMFGLTGTYKGCVTSDATVTAARILTGYSAYGSAGTKINGTMPNRGTVNHSLAANGSFTIADGLHSGSGKVTQSIPTQSGVTVTPGTSAKLLCSANKWTTGDIWVAGDIDLNPGAIKKGVTIFGVTGTYEGCVTTSATITADKILTGYSAYGSAGTKINGTMPNNGAISHSLPANGSYTIPYGWHNGNGRVSQNITVQSGKTVTPGTGNILLCSADRWLNGDIWINGDSNLKAENIKRGVNIFGVTGTHDGFPSPTPNGDGTFSLVLFENNTFVRGGIVQYCFCQCKGTAHDDVDGFTDNDMSWWVAQRPPVIENGGMTFYGAHKVGTNLFEEVYWAAVLKVPIPANMKIALRADAVIGPNKYDVWKELTDKYEYFWRERPTEQWPSTTWKPTHSNKGGKLRSDKWMYKKDSDLNGINRWDESLCIGTWGPWYSGSSTSDRYCGSYVITKLWANYKEYDPNESSGGDLVRPPDIIL